jgi:sporulation protein YabP
MQGQSDIIIESKSRLKLSGADGIISFSENEAVFSTVLGCLAVSGSGLTVESFDRENGEINVSGSIFAVFYPQKKSEEKGFFKRLFGN